MRLQELRGELGERLEPPLTEDEVVDAVGEIVLESPQGVEETVADALGRQGSESYPSIDAVCCAIEANVCWEFVGRRSYDDRAPNMVIEGIESF